MKGKHEILPDYKRLSDEELLRRYAHRNEHEAIHVLFDRYGHIVLGICFNHFTTARDAKDATEKIFIKLLDEARSTQVDKFKPWLLKLVNNHCAWNSTTAAPNANRIISHSQLEFEEADNRYDDDNVAELIYTLIQKLDEDQRECIEQFYFHRKDYVLVANVTGHTPQEVKAYIQKGKIFIKRNVQEALRYVRP